MVHHLQDSWVETNIKIYTDNWLLFPKRLKFKHRSISIFVTKTPPWKKKKEKKKAIWTDGRKMMLSHILYRWHCVTLMGEKRGLPQQGHMNKTTIKCHMTLILWYLIWFCWCFEILQKRDCPNQDIWYEQNNNQMCDNDTMSSKLI